jgi:hypothetical protein
VLIRPHQQAINPIFCETGILVPLAQPPASADTSGHDIQSLYERRNEQYLQEGRQRGFPISCRLAVNQFAVVLGLRNGGLTMIFVARSIARLAISH